MSADLIAKLRDMASKRYNYTWGGWVQEQCTKAADRIVAVEAENAELRAALHAQQGDAVSTDELSALLPGVYCMDPPDGGSVTVLEQVRRMAEDAARWREAALSVDIRESGDFGIACNATFFGMDAQTAFTAFIDAALAARGEG